MLDTEALEELECYEELRGIWRRDPVLYFRQRLATNPTRQQGQLIRAVAPPGSKVTCRAAHGVGKTTAVAGIIWWHLECFDFCKIPCTAPTASQLHLVLWSQLAKLQRQSDDASRANGLPPGLWLSNCFKTIQDHIFDPSAPTEWFAAARTARKEKPDALQGFHASDLIITDDDVAVQRSESGGALLFVIEEASGVDDVIFEVAEGALNSRGARLLMVGNPVRSTGFFARSHRDNAASYTTLHFKSKDSPLSEPSFRDNLVRDYGEGSNVVRVRADGEFPKQDDDVLIGFEVAEAALRCDPIDEPGAKRVLGVDVARFGNDRTTYVLRVGNQVPFIEVRAKEDTMATVGRALVLREQLRADSINVDEGGVGGGVVDRLREQRAPVIAVNAGETATMAPPKPVTPLDTRAPQERFERRDSTPKLVRDYLWLAMADWFKLTQPSLSLANSEHAKTLVAEVSSVRYRFDSSGKIVVESKDDMKRRGLRSPDVADGLGLTFAPENDLSIWARL